jgi:hypothetical protein
MIRTLNWSTRGRRLPRREPTRLANEGQVSRSPYMDVLAVIAS